MAVVRRTIHRPASEVFGALVDPYTYPHWLIGCREIRSVDDGWPAVGRAFHHRVGLIGPLAVADSAESLAVEPGRQLSMEVRFRPAGRGRVTFTVSTETASDHPTALIEVDEVPIGLLAHLRPLLDLLIAHRNRGSMTNLAEYLEHGEPRDAAVG